MAKAKRPEQCAFFSIKNFAQYQHYKKRNPPWVKLHYSILDDAEFLGLDLVSQRNLMVLFMVAGKKDNRISNDKSYLQKVMRLETPPDLTPLFHSGWLLAQSYQSASKSLATKRKHFATPETETETDSSEAKAEAKAETDKTQKQDSPQAPQGDASEIKNSIATVEWLQERFERIPGVKPTLNLTGECMVTVKARLREHPKQEWWERLLTELVEPSDFLCGRVNGFQASLVWLCGPKNISKVQAGQYLEKRSKGKDWSATMAEAKRLMEQEGQPT